MAELTRKEKDLKNAYLRKWRADNKDKVRQHTKNHWKRKAMKAVTEVSVTKESTTKSEKEKDVTLNDTLNDTLKVSVTCRNCGEIFKAKRKTAKYCSERCRIQYNRNNKS
ncbi:MAG: hypothetical protein R6U04_02660 [Bacteroidales bacterium]